MDKPFVLLGIPLALGIVISYYFHFNMGISFVLIAIGIIFYIYNLIMSEDNLASILFVIFGVGIILGTYSLNNSKLSQMIDEEHKFIALIDEIVYIDSDESKYIVKIEKIDEMIVGEKIILKTLGDKPMDLGDRIKFTGVLREPMENTNPLLYNYKLNLLTKKIYTIMTIKDYSIELIQQESRTFKYVVKSNFRQYIENIFDNNLNEENSSLMKSIILGEYSYLDEKNIERYRGLGLAHILAVSGLHIGIIAGFLIYIFSHLGIKRRYNIVITLIIIWVYGYLIGFPPSTIRTNIMFSILFYSQTVAEPYDSTNSLFFALCTLLIINPMWIFSLGLQLSFVASFFIVCLTPKIQSMFYPHKNKVVYSLSGLLAVQIGLLPIQAYYFNNLTIWSILANLILAPILSLSLILGGISLLFSPISIILNPILSLQFKIMNLIPLGLMKIYSPSIGYITTYYIIIFFIFGFIKLDKINLKIKRFLVCYLIFTIIFNLISTLFDKSVEIDFIDVGQGDSILINTKKGRYLIDTGGNVLNTYDVGQNITLPYLEKNGIHRLKGVFITHFDEDHCQALPLLIENIKIDNILISYKDEESPIYRNIKDSQIPVTILKERDLIALDKDLTIEVISPNASMVSNITDKNNLSLVFIMRYYNKNILFTGDMEKETELEILDKIHEPIDIIKVPHHGSNSSSTMELLNKTRPKIGVISVGRNNLYNHPRKEVLDRYDTVDTLIYRTDTMGMIRIALDKDLMEVDSFLRSRLGIMKLIYDYILYISFYFIYYLILYILIKNYSRIEMELN